MAYIFYGFLAIVTIIITFRIFNSFRSTDDILKREDEKLQANSSIKQAVILMENLDGSISHIVKKGMDIKSFFYSASITKLYTHAIIFRLLDNHVISIEDLITDLLTPEITEKLLVLNGKDITSKIKVSHLLNQTSGLADYETDKIKGKEVIMDRLKKDDFSVSEADAIELNRLLPARSTPSEKAHYSNLNVILLGEIAKIKTGKSLPQLFQEYIFNPLYLKETKLLENNSIEVEDIVPIYIGEKPVQLPLYISTSSSAGGIITNAVELITFLKAFYTGKLFNLTNIKNAVYLPIQFFPLKYGAGQMYVKLNFLMSPFIHLPEIMGHSGSSGSFAFYSPENNTFIVGTTNQSGNIHIRLFFSI